MMRSSTYTNQKAKLATFNKMFSVNRNVPANHTQKKQLETRKTINILSDRFGSDAGFITVEGSKNVRNFAKSLDSGLNDLSRPTSLADFELQFGEMRRQLELDILREKNVTVQKIATLEKLNEWFRSLKKYTVDPRLEQLKKDLDSLSLLED